MCTEAYNFVWKNGWILNIRVGFYWGGKSDASLACTYYVLYSNLNDGEVEKSVNESISVVRLLREAMKIGINKQILKNIEYEIWKLIGLNYFPCFDIEQAYLKAPPISTRPFGDIQLEWLTLASPRLWDWIHSPMELRMTQLVAVASVSCLPPPQLIRPSCVWPTRGEGSSGMEQWCGMPNDDKTSTVESSSPPVMIITEIVGGEWVSITSMSQESNLF